MLSKKSIFACSMTLVLSSSYAMAACATNSIATGSGLNGQTRITVCYNNGVYVTSISGSHDNNGEHDHTGYVRIADNRNWGINGRTLTLRPDDTSTKSFDFDDYVDNDWRICAVWVKSPSGTFTNHACLKRSGTKLVRD